MQENLTKKDVLAYIIVDLVLAVYQKPSMKIQIDNTNIYNTQDSNLQTPFILKYYLYFALKTNGTELDKNYLIAMFISENVNSFN